jgi:hypothetical protein
LIAFREVTNQSSTGSACAAPGPASAATVAPITTATRDIHDFIARLLLGFATKVAQPTKEPLTLA